jgi:hypothetical protein
LNKPGVPARIRSPNVMMLKENTPHGDVRTMPRLHAFLILAGPARAC